MTPNSLANLHKGLPRSKVFASHFSLLSSMQVSCSPPVYQSVQYLNPNKLEFAYSCLRPKEHSARSGR